MNFNPTFLINYLLNLLFPIFCLGCRKEGSFLCADCTNKIELLDFQVCHICKKLSLNGRTCPKCRSLFQLDGLIVSAHYDLLLQKIIKQYKYRFSQELRKNLVDILLKTWPKSWDGDDFLLSFVPLYLSRKRWRGFNQAEDLAKYLEQKLAIPVVDILKRRKNTPTQTNLPRVARLKNLDQAFVLKNIQFDKSKTIILVDDIVSTGATLESCAKVLKEAGVKKVWGAVIGRG